MNQRIQQLREKSLSIVPYISPERALLITAFYWSDSAMAVSVPVRRALAFRHILENKAICINEGELIIGERGPGPKATPTYPEVCCHSIRDLEILDSREKIQFKASDEVKEIYREQLIPFWQGNSMRDRIFREVSNAWKDAYEAGIFTEFMEQRAPGHTVLDDKIYHKGFLGFKEDIARA